MTCPHCGADVQDKATSCRECGSDAESGWAKFAHHYGHLSYEGSEDSIRTPAKKRSRAFMVAVALALIVSYVFLSIAPVLGIALLLGGGIYFLMTFLETRDKTASKKNLFRELLRYAGGDRQLAERLIKAEWERYPNLQRAELIQRAVWRFEHDR